MSGGRTFRWRRTKAERQRTCPPQTSKQSGPALQRRSLERSENTCLERSTGERVHWQQVEEAFLKGIQCLHATGPDSPPCVNTAC